MLPELGSKPAPRPTTQHKHERLHEAAGAPPARPAPTPTGPPFSQGPSGPVHQHSQLRALRGSITRTSIAAVPPNRGS